MAKIFLDGIIYVVAYVGLIASFSIMTLVVAPRMVHSRGCATLGDFMKSLHGTYSGILVGIFSFSIIGCLAGMDLFLLGTICESLLGISAS